MNTTPYYHKQKISYLVYDFIATFTCSILLVAVLTPSIVSAGSDSYPTSIGGCRYVSNGASAGTCDLKDSAQDYYYDPWSEENRECVSYVAWMLSSVNGYTMPFHDYAVNWGADARSNGITVDMNPVVGSVYWTTSPSPYGHVAYVEAVSADKSTITIEDYNAAYTGLWAEHPNIAASTASGYIHFKDAGTTTIGQFDASTATWYLRTSNTPGPANDIFTYGGGNWKPVVGDWNYDRLDSIGAVDPSTQTFYLRNENNSGSADAGVAQFGGGGMIPVVGDWNGDGTSTIGQFDPGTATWYLRNSNTSGSADDIFQFGFGGAIPIVGDWNGDGIESIGVFNPTNATFYLRNSNNAGSADDIFQFGGGGWKPVIGDWNADGTDTIGVVDPTSQTFYLRNSNNAGNADIVVQFGSGGWTPIAGDWNGQ